MITAFLLTGLVFSQVSFGPRAGMTFSNYAFNFKHSDEEPYTRFKAGPAFGGVVNIQFTDFLALQPALMFIKKGASEDFEEIKDNNPEISSLSGFSRLKVGYIEVPINVAAGLDLGPGQIQVFFGPYIAFALFGRQRVDFTYRLINGESGFEKDTYYLRFKNKVLESDWEDYEDDDDFFGFQKLIDMGLNFGIGYKYQAILFNFGYSLGLTNLEPKQSDINEKNYKYSNRVIYFNVAWLFGEE